MSHAAICEAWPEDVLSNLRESLSPFTSTVGVRELAAAQHRVSGAPPARDGQVHIRLGQTLRRADVCAS
jgi:hypothetical protein